MTARCGRPAAATSTSAATNATATGASGASGDAVRTASTADAALAAPVRTTGVISRSPSASAGNPTDSISAQPSTRPRPSAAHAPGPGRPPLVAPQYTASTEYSARTAAASTAARPGDHPSRSEPRTTSGPTAAAPTTAGTEDQPAKNPVYTSPVRPAASPHSATSTATPRAGRLTGAPFGVHAVTDRHFVPRNALC